MISVYSGQLIALSVEASEGAGGAMECLVVAEDRPLKGRSEPKVFPIRFLGNDAERAAERLSEGDSFAFRGILVPGADGKPEIIGKALAVALRGR